MSGREKLAVIHGNGKYVLKSKDGRKSCSDTRDKALAQEQLFRQ